LSGRIVGASVKRDREPHNEEEGPLVTGHPYRRRRSWRPVDVSSTVTAPTAVWNALWWGII